MTAEKKHDKQMAASCGQTKNLSLRKAEFWSNPMKMTWKEAIILARKSNNNKNPYNPCTMRTHNRRSYNIGV